MEIYIHNTCWKLSSEAVSIDSALNIRVKHTKVSNKNSPACSFLETLRPWLAGSGVFD